MIFHQTMKENDFKPTAYFASSWPGIASLFTSEIKGVEVEVFKGQAGISLTPSLWCESFTVAKKTTSDQPKETNSNHFYHFSFGEAVLLCFSILNGLSQQKVVGGILSEIRSSLRISSIFTWNFILRGAIAQNACQYIFALGSKDFTFLFKKPKKYITSKA